MQVGFQIPNRDHRARVQSERVCACVCVCVCVVGGGRRQADGFSPQFDNREWQVHVVLLSFPLLSPSSLASSIHRELRAPVHGGCSTAEGRAWSLLCGIAASTSETLIVHRRESILQLVFIITQMSLRFH